MYSVILGIAKLAKELGVIIETNSSLEKIIVNNKKATGIIINGKEIVPAIYDQIREIDSEICALINNQSVHYFYLPEMKLIQVNLVSE